MRKFISEILKVLGAIFFFIAIYYSLEDGILDKLDALIISFTCISFSELVEEAKNG